MRIHTTSPKHLPQLWRTRAEVLRENGAPNHARLLEHVAGELDRAIAAGGDEALSLVQAARQSGYSAGHLGSLIARNVIPNAGRPGSPRIRRSDLPTKDGKKPGRPSRKSKAEATRIATAFREEKRKV